METLIDKLKLLQLKGMAVALERQTGNPDSTQLSFSDRLRLMIDSEECSRKDRRYNSRLRAAKLKDPNALVENFEFSSEREVKKSQVLELSQCEWIRGKKNLCISGPTGAGKTFLSCALAHRACMEGLSVKYLRVPRLLQELEYARADGSYLRKLSLLQKMDLIILDDWGMSALTQAQRQDLFELIEDRYGLRSLIVSSQIPVEQWFELIGDPNIADAICDRVVNASIKIAIKGDSRRGKEHIDEKGHRS